MEYEVQYWASVDDGPETVHGTYGQAVESARRILQRLPEIKEVLIIEYAHPYFEELAVVTRHGVMAL